MIIDNENENLKVYEWIKKRQLLFDENSEITVLQQENYRKKKLLI